MKKVMGIICKVICGILAFTGLIFILLICVLFRLSSETPPVPEKTVVVLDLAQPYAERPMQGVWSIGGESFSFLDLTLALERIKTDSRIKGLFIKMDDNSLSAAQAEEVRKQIIAIKKEGKKTYAYAASYPSLLRYYLASSAETIAIQPSGDMMITGLRMEAPFFKGLLTKIGVKAVFEARHEYKSGPAQWTQERFSKEQKENIKTMLDGTFKHVIAEIKKERPDFDRGLIDVAPLTAEEAVTVKLVDEYAYEIPMKNAIRKELGFEDFFAIEDYITAVRKENEKKGTTNEIAVFSVAGMILRGTTEESEETDAILDQAVVEVFQNIILNENVKAVVFRIDSPGGGFQPSDVIYEGLKNLKKKGVPLFVSMGETAASGGYYIALPADMIFADELSITGSIGVYGGKFVISGLLEKLGITVDTMQFGENAGIMSSTSDFSDNERRAFAKMINMVYEKYTAKVIEHRNVDIDAVARGRIFTGKEAFEKGLVDINGSLIDAINYAAELQKLSDYKVVKYPNEDEDLMRTLKKLKRMARKPVSPPKLASVLSVFKKLEQQEMRLFAPVIELK